MQYSDAAAKCAINTLLETFVVISLCVVPFLQISDRFTFHAPSNAPPTLPLSSKPEQIIPCTVALTLLLLPSHALTENVYCCFLQVYGYQSIKNGQSSEQLMGRFVKGAPKPAQPLVVGTKFFTVPWTNVLVGGGFRLGRQSMLNALRASLKRMDRPQIDLWQVSPKLWQVLALFWKWLACA